MINNQVLVEFNGGDIGIAISEDGKHIGFCNLKSIYAIGHLLNEQELKEESEEDFKVVFKFNKPESIDVVIKRLLEAKEIMLNKVGD